MGLCWNSPALYEAAGTYEEEDGGGVADDDGSGEVVVTMATEVLRKMTKMGVRVL